MPYKFEYRGSWCVYYTYYIAHKLFYRIIYGGTQEACEKYVNDYNRMSPEKYRCQLKTGDMKQIQKKIIDLYNQYGVGRDND